MKINKKLLSTYTSNSCIKIALANLDTYILHLLRFSLSSFSLNLSLQHLTDEEKVRAFPFELSSRIFDSQAWQENFLASGSFPTGSDTSCLALVQTCGIPLHSSTCRRCSR